MVGAKNVASVDGTEISIREYQNALTRQVEFFGQMMGGNTLTQKQIEEMGIKQSVISGLIQQKLVLNAANKMGIHISLDEVKGEIKSLPYFNRNEQFDVNLYRNVLQSNGYNPTQFEELIGTDIKQRKFDSLFATTLTSENFTQDVLNFKKSGVVVHGVKISRQALAPLVSISAQEIKDYAAKEENQKTLENLYTENYAKYNSQAEVKARHILIKDEDDKKALEKIKAIKSKVNAKNFAAVALKESQDPTAQTNSGDLGWFSKGRMVPEFEEVAFKMKKGQISEPIKTQFGYHIILLEDTKVGKSTGLNEVKEELARTAIQKMKSQDLDELLKAQEAKIQANLKNNQLAEIENLQKKIDLQLFKNTTVNQFDQYLGQIVLSTKETEQIFNAQAGDIVNLGNSGTIYLVKVLSKAAPVKDTAESLAAEVTTQNQNFSRKVREELVKKLNDKAKIVTNNQIL